MACLAIPPLLRPLCDGAAELELPGVTVRELLQALIARYPAVGPRLLDGERLQPALAIGVDGELGARNLSARVRPDSRVSIIPAMAGGGLPLARAGIDREQVAEQL